MNTDRIPASLALKIETFVNAGLALVDLAAFDDDSAEDGQLVAMRAVFGNRISGGSWGVAGDMGLAWYLTGNGGRVWRFITSEASHNGRLTVTGTQSHWHR
tara:strand:- start:3085 stop:3387 length:303 start_codon:yes stop_codon:yes gene_type:complete